jgi:hypothetical protein
MHTQVQLSQLTITYFPLDTNVLDKLLQTQ